MKRLKWFDFLSINLFWLGLNIRNNAVGSIFTPYLVDIFAREEIKNTALAGIRTAGLIVAMVVQPVMGILSDRSTSRFGRRRPYIFIGVLLDLVMLAAIGFSWDYISLLVAILLMQVTSNISHGPLQALITDLVPEEQRGVASGVKAIMELLPLILIGFTIAKLVGMGEFTWALVATGGALLVLMLLTLVLVKEEPLTEKPDLPLREPMGRVAGMLAGIGAGAAAGLIGGALVGGIAGLIALGIGGSDLARSVGFGVGGAGAMAIAIVIGVQAGTRSTLGKEWREQKSFTWWVVNRLFFMAAVTSIQSYAPFFLMYAFDINREAAVEMTGNLLMMVGAFTLVTAIPGGWISDRFGYKRVVGGSCLAAAVGTCVLLITIWQPQMSLIYTAGAILGLATGLFVTGNWALGTNIVPPAEAGRYLGISNLAGAGAGMIGTGIGGPVADILNASLPGLGYFAIFASYGLLFLLGAVSLRWIEYKREAG